MFEKYQVPFLAMSDTACDGSSRQWQDPSDQRETLGHGGFRLSRLARLPVSTCEILALRLASLRAYSKLQIEPHQAGSTCFSTSIIIQSGKS